MTTNEIPPEGTRVPSTPWKGTAHAEKMREVWAARSEADRARHAKTVAASTAEGREAIRREQELAKRAGTPCPCCGRPVGRNGMCLRSQSCMDEALFIIAADYDPAALYDPSPNDRAHRGRVT